MICLEGIVTKTSLVRPKVVFCYLYQLQILRSVHYCPEGKQKYYYKDYVDMLNASSNHPPTTSVIPHSNGNRIIDIVVLIARGSP